MNRQLNLKSALVLSFCCFSLLPTSVSAVESSLALFQYATPLELPSLSSSRLVEIRFTEAMYTSLRSDFADLRVVQQSNNGAVPVKVVRFGPPEHALVSRPFSRLEEIPAELAARYPQSGIVLFESAREPLTTMRVSLDKDASAALYMLLGRGGIHATGAEWSLLKHMRADGGLSRIDITFQESNFDQYALVVDPVKSAQFHIESVFGPDYYAYFEIQPDEAYTLLCGYPDAPPLAGFNTASVDALLKKGVKPVAIKLGLLVENELWSGRSLKGFAFKRSFLIPLAVVALLIILLLVFVVVYTVTNRKRPVKMEPRPRFYR